MSSTQDVNLNIKVTVDTSALDEARKQLAEWAGEGVAGTVVKSDDERRYTLTVAYPANKPDAGVARDGHQDFASAAEVENMAWDYMLKSRQVGLWHENGTEGSGDVVESYIYRGPDWRITAADGSEQVVKSGDWLLGVRWAEDTFPLVKSGEIGGVSMQGKANRRVPTPRDIANLRKNR